MAKLKILIIGLTTVVVMPAIGYSILKTNTKAHLKALATTCSNDYRQAAKLKQPDNVLFFNRAQNEAIAFNQALDAYLPYESQATKSAIADALTDVIKATLKYNNSYHEYQLTEKATVAAVTNCKSIPINDFDRSMASINDMQLNAFKMEMAINAGKSALMETAAAFDNINRILDQS